VPGDAQTTHTANVLHLLLPAGERWFVDVYRQVLPEVTDPRLTASGRLPCRVRRRRRSARASPGGSGGDACRSDSHCCQFRRGRAQTFVEPS
jgi:hypothetical protein